MFSLIFSFLFLSPNGLLITAAVVPAIVLLIYVYRRDRVEKEPDSMLLLLVLFGAISTLLAVVAESFGSALLDALLPGGAESEEYAFWMFFVVVGLSEELSKYLILRWRTWRSPHFDCRFDAVVYAVFVSLGFALWENVGYVLIYGFGAALMRAITAVPGHASFGVFMGACYGLAKNSDVGGRRGSRAFWNWLAVLLPAVIHGCYDYIAVNESASFSTTFLVFIVAVFLSAFLLVKRLSHSDRYLDGA